MKKILSLALLSTLVVSPVTLFADDVNNNTTASTQQQEPQYTSPTGVELKFNDDGSVRAIIATGEADLQFGDRKDIRKAVQVATMRAKANISKFMSEDIKSSENLAEVTETLVEQENENTKASRKTAEMQLEAISNNSQAILTGVVTLKQDINKNEKYVSVTVGVKEQTIQAATGISNSINQGMIDRQNYVAQNSNGNSQASNSTNSNSDNSGRVVRQSAMYNDF